MRDKRVGKMLLQIFTVLLCAAAATVVNAHDFRIQDSEWKLVGCYVRNSSRFDTRQFNFATECMTQRMCRDRCFGLTYKYFGVSYEACYCGHNLPEEIGEVTENELCGRETEGRCPGDGVFWCGKIGSIMIFETATPVPRISGVATVPRGEPIGCFATSSLKIEYEHTTGSNTPVDCIHQGYCRRACKLRDFKYFGIQSGNKCFCWSRLPCVDPVYEEARCSTPCRGNSSEKCGGAGTVSLFRVSRDAPIVCSTSQGSMKLPLFNCSVLLESSYNNCSTAMDGKTELRASGSIPKRRVLLGHSAMDGYAWWKAQTKQSAQISRVVLHIARLTASIKNDLLISVDGKQCAASNADDDFLVKSFPCESYGQIIKVQNNLRKELLFLKEVEVFGEYLFETVPGATYLGCYRDGTDMELKMNKENNTLAKCMASCNDMKYKYFATTNATYFNCICGNSFDTYARLSEDACSSDCPGDAREICGGTSSKSVYAAVPYDRKMPLEGVQTRFDGCYTVPLRSCSMTPTTVSPPGNMTIAKCYRQCLKTSYLTFGVYGGSMCGCGTRTCFEDETMGTECNLKCAGDNRNFCGGVRRINIYKILILNP